MTFVVRDPHFTMTFQDIDAPRPVRYHHHVSFAKQIERRVISIWKVVTRSSRKQPRNSYLSRDFSFVTSRRRSTFAGQLNQFYLNLDNSVL